MENVIKNIRKNNIKCAIGLLIPALLFTGIFIGFLYRLITNFDELGFGYLLILAILGLVGYIIDKAFIVAIQLTVNPLRDDIFKKYGSPEKIAKILEEIKKTKIYEDKRLVISKNYISDKKDYSKIVSCKDVLGAHKLVHKTNYVTDYYQIVITDKYNQTTTYQYGTREEEKVNQLLAVIGSICPNAELGYTQKEQEHIKNNSVELPESIKEEEKFICNNCGSIVESNAKECPNCGEEFEDEKSFNNLDDLYSFAQIEKNNNNFESAKEYFEKYCKETEKILKESDKTGYTFNNCVELAIAINQKAISEDSIDFNYKTNTAYTNLAFIAFEEKDYNLAIKYLNKALKFNPCDVSALFELAENYKAKGDLTRYLSTTKKIYEKIYTINDLAHYYRNLGFYYIEKKEWNLSKNLYLYSLKYNNSPVVTKELYYIAQITNNKELPNEEDTRQVLKENNIPIFIKKDNLNIIKDLKTSLKKQGQENSNVSKFIDELIKVNSNS